MNTWVKINGNLVVILVLIFVVGGYSCGFISDDSSFGQNRTDDDNSGNDYTSDENDKKPGSPGDNSIKPPASRNEDKPPAGRNDEEPPSPGDDPGDVSIPVEAIPIGGNDNFISTELLGRPTADSVTVNIEPRQACYIYFEYGTATEQYTDETTVQHVQANTPTDIEIDGLTKDTQYYYRMRFSASQQDTFVSGEENSFHTQRAPGKQFVFTVQTDSHINLIYDEQGKLDNYAQTFQNVGFDRPDFMLDLGDLSMAEYAYGGGTHASYPGDGPDLVWEWYRIQRNFFASIAHSIPVYLALGGHDGESTNHADEALQYAAKARLDLFPNPSPNDFYSGDHTTYDFLGGAYREAYYTWTWGDARFVVLDGAYYKSQSRGDGDSASHVWRSTLGEEQYDWLVDTLTNSNEKFKFVFLHNLIGGCSSDRESSGRGGVECSDLGEWGGRNELRQSDNNNYVFDEKRPGWGRPIHDVLVDTGVTVVFRGHDHFYAYQHHPDGLAYLLVPQSSVDGRAYNPASYDGHVEEYQYQSGVVLGKGGHIRCTVFGDDKVTCDYVHTVNRFVNHTFSCTPSAGCDVEGTLMTR